MGSDARKRHDGREPFPKDMSFTVTKVQSVSHCNVDADRGYPYCTTIVSGVHTASSLTTTYNSAANNK